MQLIECPYCGLREEAEYHYGGQAHVAYPGDAVATSDAEWAQYLFFRDNPAGRFAERWMHAAGCRRWFNAIRDTTTHQIHDVYRLNDPRPGADPIRLSGAETPRVAQDFAPLTTETRHSTNGTGRPG